MRGGDRFGNQTTIQLYGYTTLYILTKRAPHLIKISPKRVYNIKIWMCGRNLKFSGFFTDFLVVAGLKFQNFRKTHSFSSMTVFQDEKCIWPRIGDLPRVLHFG